MDTNKKPVNKPPAHAGRTVLYVMIAVVALLTAGGALYMVMGGSDSSSSTSTTPSPTSPSTASNVSWQRGESGWQASGIPPACPDPLTFKAPVDLSKVTSILYPGQQRSGGYRAHGGFRFDKSTANDITVTAPLDASVIEGSRYIEEGEVQYLFTFIHPCGLMYRFDHLLTLSEPLQKLADTLPEAKVGDSRTTSFSSPLSLKQGEVVATAVGHRQTPNVFIDWGVYDLRQKNAASQDPAWAQAHPSDQEQYGVCWFDLLSDADEAIVRSLPPGNSIEGKTSDYCK